MWDLIVSVPDHCLSFYFGKTLTTLAGFLLPRITMLGVVQIYLLTYL